MRRTASLPLPLLLTALLLAGCTDPSPMPTPPSTPSQTPVFASDEEALAAAEEAYGKYLATVALVLADGGKDPERLSPLVGADLYDRDIPGYQQFAEEGWRGIGKITFTMSAQNLDLESGELNTYVCEDRSGFDVVNSAGASVVPDSRPDRTALEVGLIWDEGLKIATQEGWEGGGVCD
jgi:hypothetical protein